MDTIRHLDELDDPVRVVVYNRKNDMRTGWETKRSEVRKMAKQLIGSFPEKTNEEDWAIIEIYWKTKEVRITKLK